MGSRIIRTAGLSAFAVVYGIPFIYLFATSLKSSVVLFDAPANLLFRPTLAGYKAVLNAELLTAMKNSTIVACGTTALVVVLAIPAAYWLSRSRNWLIDLGLSFLILLQMVPQANTVIPLFIVMADWGLIGTLKSLILADAALLLPFSIIILRPFFLSIPKEIDEAARVDGSSNTRIFFEVYLPLARNGVLTAALLVWVIAWGEFLYAITFITSSSRIPVSGLLAQQVSQYGIAWDRLMALSALVTIPVLIVFVFAQRYLREGLALGATK